MTLRESMGYELNSENKKKWASLFSIPILCFILLYGIVSSTLLNPDFYKAVIRPGKTAPHDSVSIMLPTEGEITFSYQSVQKNFLSMAEGLIRFIKHNDMSLSDISLDSENAQSLYSAMTAANSDPALNLPVISKLHPFVLTYFFPDTAAIFKWLQTFQTAYTIVRFSTYILLFVYLFLLLLSKKPSGYIKKSFTPALFLMLCFICAIPIFYYRFLLPVLESTGGNIHDVILPFARYLMLRFLLQCFLVVLWLGLVLLLFRLPWLYTFWDKHCRKLAPALILTVLCLVLYHRESLVNLSYCLSTTSENREIQTLENRQDGIVHSLVIKLREEGTDCPVEDAKVIVSGTNTVNEPFWLFDTSDAQGNTRFLLPQGNYSVQIDTTAVTDAFILFEPVFFNLDLPGNSWYTLYLEKVRDECVNPESQQTENASSPDLLLP